MQPKELPSENHTEKSSEESKEYGELRLKKKGQIKHIWQIHKTPKGMPYRPISLKKTETNLKRMLIPIFDRELDH